MFDVRARTLYGQHNADKYEYNNKTINTHKHDTWPAVAIAIAASTTCSD